MRLSGVMLNGYGTDVDLDGDNVDVCGAEWG